VSKLDDSAFMWTMLPMLLLCPGLCCLCAALWSGLCGDPLCLPMLASMVHLWTAIRGISFPVTSALFLDDLTHGRLSGPCMRTATKYTPALVVLFENTQRACWLTSAVCSKLMQLHAHMVNALA
jgi:hypothetical protein